MEKEKTVKELKKDLKGIPDDYIVQIGCDYEGGDYDGILINYANKSITLEAK